MSARKAKSRARPRFTLGGVPKRGNVYPSAHEQAILRRVARPGSFLLVTQRAGGPPLFAYGDSGEAILDEKRNELDEDGFKRLSVWLDPDRNDTLFPNAPAQVWRARKPPL